MPTEYIDRPPRIQPELPIKEVEIPQPPEEGSRAGQDLLNLLIPLVTIIGFVLVSGTGNALFIIPIGLAMVLTIGMTISGSRRQRKELAAKKKAYQEKLAELRQEMNRAHNAQRIFYTHNYPDVQTVYEIAARKETSRFGSRLWERRVEDRDFGAVRLGMGTRPSSVIYRLSQGGNPLEEGPLAKDARKLAQDSEILTDVPITVPLRRFAPDSLGGEAQNGNRAAPVEARHSVGIFGKNPGNTTDFARALVAHFATFHSATDSRVYVIGHPATQASWQWTEWLPHCNVRDVGLDESFESGPPGHLDQLCFSPEKEQVTAFWNWLKRELDQRQLRMQETDEAERRQGDMSLPHLLVVVDLTGDLPADSPLAEVASEGLISTINASGPTLAPR